MADHAKAEDGCLLDDLGEARILVDSFVQQLAVDSDLAQNLVSIR
jgi:hypothetical protein